MQNLLQLGLAHQCEEGIIIIGEMAHKYMIIQGHAVMWHRILLSLI